MMISDAKHYFVPSVCDRGMALFRDSKVQLEPQGESAAIKAQVADDQTYSVTIIPSANRTRLSLGVTCSCRSARAHLAPCQHIWATLLEARKLGRLRKFENAKTKTVVHMFLHLSSRNADASTSATDGVANSGLGDRSRELFPDRSSMSPDDAASRPASHPEPSLGWLSRLNSSQAPDQVEPADTQPITPYYVIEADFRSLEGDLILSLVRPTRAQGKPGGWKKLTLKPDDVLRVSPEGDREICRMLVGAGNMIDRYGYAMSRPSGDVSIPPKTQDELVPKIFATERVLIRDDREAEPTPVRWEEGDPIELVAVVAAKESPSMFGMTLKLRQGGVVEEIRKGDRFFRGNPGLLWREGTLRKIDLHGCFSWLSEQNRMPERRFTAAQAPRVFEHLSGMAAVPPLILAPELGLSEVRDLPPVPQASLTFRAPDASRSIAMVDVDIRFRYGDEEVGGAQTLMLMTAEGRLIRRHHDAERGHLARLRDLGIKPAGDGSMSMRAGHAPQVVEALLNEGWRVLGDKQMYRRPGKFNLSIRSNVDWFDMQGGLEFEGQIVSTPQLLKAIRAGERYVVLDDGSLGLLPQEWIERHSRWLELGTQENGQVRFSRSQLPLVDALLAQMPQIDIDAQLQSARERLRAFEGVVAHPAPPGFGGQLRPYQEQGLGWLLFLQEFGWGGCLADDMGLGKTVQLLALMLHRKQSAGAGDQADGQSDRRPSLIVAPKSLTFNWVREAAKFTPQLNVLAYAGADRTGARESLGACDLIITTYGTLLRDIDHLARQPFDYVVLDEAQAIKNPSSQSAKAVGLLNAKHRLALTGTPIENHLGDLWSILEFLNPGMLGSLPAFKGATGIGTSDEQALVPLQAAIRPFILRRTKKQVLTELPERTEQTINCQMGPDQAALYKELREHYRASLLSQVDEADLKKNKFQVLEALLRLRQAACHPGLIDADKAGMESAKLEALLPMLAELVEEGHKALVFSTFTSLLALVRKSLDAQKLKYEYLDGKTRDRQERVDHFQGDPDCRLMLISLKAGGVGLNLTAADYVFILDPWWNPAAEAQAIDRAHRIGQSRHVTAYRLITLDTVEEKILQLQQTKRDLAEAIITQQNSVIGGLTREQLSNLLS